MFAVAENRLPHGQRKLLDVLMGSVRQTDTCGLPQDLTANASLRSF